MKDTELGFLSEYGDPGEMSPAWGALLGGGLTMAGVIAAKAFSRRSSGWSKYAGGVGLLAGGVPSAIMLFFHSTRRAGFLGLAVAAVTGLGELIKDLFIEPKQLAGLGLYQPEMTDGLGEERIAILGADEYEGLPMGAPLEILGQASAAQALAGLGVYQPEMTGANPIDVMGGAVVPYSGSF
jgi:hypothetical protein